MKNFVLNAMGTMFLCAAVGEEDAIGVDGFSKPNADIMEEIKKEEAERERAEQKNAAKNQLQLDKYTQEREAITLRKDRAINDAATKRLKDRTAENTAYQAGDIDTKVHKENLEKIEKEYQESVDKANRVFRDALDNLDSKNPEGRRRYRGW